MMFEKRRIVAAAAAATGLMSFAAHAAPGLGPTGNYYEVVAFPAGSDKSWNAAEAGADSRFHLGIRGHLATITSFDEDAFIDTLRRDANLNPREAWVGGHQDPRCAPELEPKCNWTWVTGEGAIPTSNDAPGYANWAPYQNGFEPNDLNGNEHHLAVGLGNAFGWNDEGALGNIGGYIVEYPGLLANDDGPVDATSGVPEDVDVLDNDTINADVESVVIESQPDSGGDSVADVQADFTVTYTSDTAFEGTDTFRYRVTDENGAFAIATVTIEVSAGEAAVDPGVNQLIFNQAKNPSPTSNNPMTAAYQQVLEGGKVAISCCRVLDEREIPRSGRRPARFVPTPFDLGLAVADTLTNPSCAGMPHIPQGTAVLRPWQRGVPKSLGFVDPGTTIDARENDLGVCLIEADVDSRGVVFSAEEAANVLGFGLNGAIDSIRYRPFTGGVSLDPAEVDAPWVTPWTAEWDESRSGKRFSDNVMVVNLWHEWLVLPSVPYLLQLTASLDQSVVEAEAAGCVENNAGFLDDLRGLLQSARLKIALAAIPWWRESFGNAAVETLNDFTRLSLLIGPDAPATDPYGLCPGNPEGLFVGRSMALKFAACSELVHPFDSASSLDGACAIEEDILCELPELPGFPHPASCSAP